MEEKSRQLNICTVGLKEGEGGDDLVRFTEKQLSKWIPSLEGKSFEVERAHHIYSADRSNLSPQTSIF